MFFCRTFCKYTLSKIKEIMNQKDKIYRILVADNDQSFSKKIINILAKKLNNCNNVKFEQLTVDNSETIGKNSDIELAFIDCKYFINDDTLLLSNLFKHNLNCFVVLLMSNLETEDLKQILNTFKKYKQHFLGEHILKDNYSDEVLAVFCRAFVDRVILKIKLNNE